MPANRKQGSSRIPTKKSRVTARSSSKPDSGSGSAKRKSKSPQKASKSSTSHTTSRRKARFRPGQRALREIRKYQATTNLSIRKLPFSRLVREIQQKINPRISHWQVEALSALQEAAEAYLVRFMQDCNEAALFANRVTIMRKDFQFINKLRWHGAA